MSKKDKQRITKMQKEYSKPQISRWERQNKMQRNVFIAGICIIVAVLVLIGLGWYFTQYRQLVAPVAKVNGTTIRMIDYIKLLRAVGKGQTASDLESYASTYLSIMEQAEIIRQGADNVDVNVTDAEIKAALEKSGKSDGYTPIIRAQLLGQKLVDEYFKSQIPTTMEQADIEAMFLESEQQATDLRAQLIAIGDNTDAFKIKFDDLASVYSLDTTSARDNGEMGQHPQDMFAITLGSKVPGDFAFSAAAGQLSQPLADPGKSKSVGYWLINVIEKGTGDNEGKVNVRAMLLSSEAEALDIKAQLEAVSSDPSQLAEKFNTLAKQYSQYTNASVDGGLIGMIGKGIMNDTTFDNVAFSLDAGKISDPVKDTTQTTKGGYWLVNVVSRVDNAEVSSDEIDSMAQQAYNDWYSQEASAAKVETVITSSQITWALNKVSGVTSQG